MPSLLKINQARSDFDFGIIPGWRREYGECDFERDLARRVVEPRPDVRGDIARAVLYMEQEYRVVVGASMMDLMRQWHLEDPPDAEERRRNDVIAKLQGTRNRFIDLPGLARR